MSQGYLTHTGMIHSVAAAPTAGGTGYAVNDVLTITTGGAAGTVTVTAVSGGVVTAVELTAQGGGYTTGAGKVSMPERHSLLFRPPTRFPAILEPRKPLLACVFVAWR